MPLLAKKKKKTEQHLWRSGLARLASSPWKIDSLRGCNQEVVGSTPTRCAQFFFFAFLISGREGRKRRGGGEEKEEEGREVEVVERWRSSRGGGRGPTLSLVACHFPSFFPSFFFLLVVSLARSYSPSCSFLLHSQFRPPSLPQMVGLPWPLGGGGKRKQSTATIPSSSIPPSFSPSTASPAVSAAHAAPGHLPIRVDPQTVQQVWQGWGTSLCWWANVVGEAMKIMNFDGDRFSFFFPPRPRHAHHHPLLFPPSFSPP